MAAKWKSLTKEEIERFAAESKSNMTFLKKMGYTGTGGNTTRVMNDIKKEYPDIDFSHFTGQGWKKNQNSYDKLSENYEGKKETIKRALVSVRGWRCECCGLSIWNEEDIPLEVHHIDGDNKNNDPDNLILLCPNCHAQTDNYRGRNIEKTIQKREYVSDEEFLEALNSSKNIRQALLKLGLNAKGANYERAYRLLKGI